MANEKINKVIYAGQTLIDLTSDTVTAASLLKNITAHDKAGETITGTCTYDSDTTDATAAVAEILSGKTAYVNKVKLTGTMPNRGAVAGVISTKTAYTIPQGYHDGSGTVSLDTASSAALVANNIRQGITILGVEGTMSGTEDVNAQAKTVTPSTSQQVITADSPTYNYLSQVTVAAISYTETVNAAGGLTATIAGS